MRRILIIGGIVLAVVVVIAVIVLASGGPANRAAGLDLRRATVLPGDIQVTISAAGKVEPEQTATISFPSSLVGIVDLVRVDVGDRVIAGDSLARLDNDTLRITHESALLDFEIQQLVAEQLLEPPSSTELAGYQANVWAASQQYNDLVNPDPINSEIARLQALQANSAFNQAYNRQRAQQWYLPDSQRENVQAQSGMAWVQSEMARLQYEQLANGPRSEDLAVAGAAAAVANAQLQQAAAGPGELEIERSDIMVEQQQIAVERAREELANATLRAPFNGIISAVNVKVGAPPPPGFPAFEMIDDSVFHINVEVDEIDVGDVEVGQQVFVSVDALPDYNFTGTVSSIAPSATDLSGVVSYIVRVDLDPTTAPLLAGMTTTVDIVIEEVAGRLSIPNWAIRIDRRTGDTFVNIINDQGELIEIKVELGLRGDTFSEVMSGLDEGQEVVVDQGSDVNFFGEE